MSDTRHTLETTARAMVAPGKGILAADESTGTMTKRLAAVDVDSTEDSRRRYRELLFTTPDAERHISGVILYDETIRQAASDGTPFSELLAGRGMIPGIKVDTGAKPLAGADEETVTEGLDGLRERLEEYRGLGARFAKWRAVIAIGDGRPSAYAIAGNAHALGRYAALCQEAAVVPIVEPEVLMDGEHTIERSEESTEATLRAVFARAARSARAARRNGAEAQHGPVRLRLPAAGERRARSPHARWRCFAGSCPPPCRASPSCRAARATQLASAHLSAMNAIGGAPWELSFSYGRALQAAPLQAWSGREENAQAAQSAFAHRARCNGEARRGRYSEELERAHAA